MYSMECKLNVMMFNARSESWYVLFSPARIQLINLNENLWQTRKKETKRKEKRMRGAAKINTMFKCDTRRHTHQMRSTTYLNAREIKVEEKSTHITLWDTQSKRTHTVNIDCSSDNQLMYQHLYDFYLGYWLPIWEGDNSAWFLKKKSNQFSRKNLLFTHSNIHFHWKNCFRIFLQKNYFRQNVFLLLVGIHRMCTSIWYALYSIAYFTKYEPKKSWCQFIICHLPFTLSKWQICKSIPANDIVLLCLRYNWKQSPLVWHFRSIVNTQI